MESVKGSRGYWHATDGEWVGNNKLTVLCRGETEGISPNNQSEDIRKVDCPRCLKSLEARGIE